MMYLQLLLGSVHTALALHSPLKYLASYTEVCLSVCTIHTAWPKVLQNYGQRRAQNTSCPSTFSPMHAALYRVIVAPVFYFTACMFCFQSIWTCPVHCESGVFAITRVPRS